MIIVGQNLKQLIKQYKIVDKIKCFDETCITLSLGDDVKYLIPRDGEENPTLTYGQNISSEYIRCNKIDESGLLLQKKKALLVCSYEKIKMPIGYMGFIQTKGTLARYFVLTNFADGQIDSGYSGKVTLEMFNGSDFDIIIPKRAALANLYIFKTSTNNYAPYSGKYQNSNIPSHPIFD